MTQGNPTQLIYPLEKTLKRIMMGLGIFMWLILIITSVGTLIPCALIVYMLFIVLQSAFISHIKGNGIRLSHEQFPDVYQQYLSCCERLEMPATPRVYVLEGGGIINALATHFLRTHFVVLLSDTIDAMDQHPDGVKFYLGHELGHIKRKHLSTQLWCLPALWLPLLGAAYSRAQEQTCDVLGAACCSSKENAARSLVALATGGKRWKTLNLNAYLAQNSETAEFWMSLNEITGGYPWLSKRVARVLGEERTIPSRNPLAYICALYIPYLGRDSVAASLLIYIYIFIFTLVIFSIQNYKENPSTYHSHTHYYQSQELSD